MLLRLTGRSVHRTCNILCTCSSYADNTLALKQITFYTVRSVLPDVSSVSKKLFALRRSKRQSTHSLRRSAYPHQPAYADTLYVLPPRRRRPKLVLTGTSIPLYFLHPLFDSPAEILTMQADCATSLYQAAFCAELHLHALRALFHLVVCQERLLLDFSWGRHTGDAVP